MPRRDINLNFILLFLLLPLLLLSACTSKKIIRDYEYVYTVNAARNGNFEKALSEFPKKEKNGFITTVEKNWLGFWVNDVNLNLLQKQTKTFDERKYISISKEAEYFFYQESEDGYIPAEHEVIILHLLNAQIYLTQNKVESAQVELRKANYLFLGFFKFDQNHFDDPALRIWQGALWAASGQWQEAQVDFRRAYEITKNTSLLPLLNMKTAPAEMTLSFSGLGPELKWIDSQLEPEFIVANSKNQQEASEIPSNESEQISSSKQVMTEVSFSSEAWYKRHIERNHVTRDVLLKSNYMTQFLGIKTSAAAQSVASYSFTTTLKIIGVAAAVVVTAGVLYVAANTTGSGEALGYIAAAGYGFGSYMWKESERIQDRVNNKIRQEEKEQFEKLRTYRFVRFLPNHISLSLSANSSQKVISIPGSPTKLYLVHANL